MTSFLYRSSPGAKIFFSIAILLEFATIPLDSKVSNPILITIIGIGLLWLFGLNRDKKRSKGLTYSEITKGFNPQYRWINQRNFICKEQGCPKEDFRKEISTIISELEDGKIYRAYTHKSVINEIAKHQLIESGEVSLFILQGKRKNVSKLLASVANENCEKCENRNCSIPNAIGNRWKTQFYGIELKRVKK